MQDREKRLMLISNSYCFGQGYLEHCASAIPEFLGPINHLVFIPYAKKDWDAYTNAAREGFGKMGITIQGVHEVPGQPHMETLLKAKAVFVGGGNTYLLLKQLYDYNLFVALTDMVNSGRVPYLGASAGANVAGPTIRTTNDWRVVDPTSMDALNFLPLQFNPHYIDHDPSSTHMGENRDQKIAEYHEHHDTPVIGLREGSWIIFRNGEARLGGKGGAKIFARGIMSAEWKQQHGICF